MTLAALGRDYDMRPCPFCGEAKVRLIEWQRMNAVRCLNLQCGARGPNRWDVDEAMEAWNQRGRMPPQA
jgi:Lar family restriction alleviation protein